jgi:Arc/MetJ-type ribon-helix-helix transcriptional regulator
MKSRISGRISREEKDKIRALVGKKVFPSMSEFYRVAISRLLSDLEQGRRRGGKSRDKGEEMKDLVKLIDDVY